MEDSLGSSDSEKELTHELLDAGIKLCCPPSSTDELLPLLDKVEDILSQVGQDPSRSMRDALFPSMKSLVSNGLLRHPLMEVKVSVVSCIHEIIRITAPCQPYDDEKMKEIFELTVAAFGMLSHLSGHCYSKALEILETVAKVRSCVMLLDFGCDALIVQIFQLFFDTIRSNHPHSVFSSMEEIMTWLIDESDDISLELLRTLLASVKKENQTVSPISWKLGEEVLKCCSAKIQPYLSKAVKFMRIDFDDYNEIVNSLCQDEPTGGNLVAEDVKPDAVHLKEIGQPTVKLDDLNIQKSSENDIILKDQNSLKTFEQLKSTKGKSSLKSETLANGVVLDEKTDGANPSRRGRKRNSLMNREVGYNHSWIDQGKNSCETPHEKNDHQNVANLAKNSSPKESPGTLHVDFVNSPNTQGQSRNDISRKRRGRPKKDGTAKDVLLLGQVKENGEQNSSAALVKVSGNAEVAEEKTRRGSRRKKYPRMSHKEAIPALSMVKKENDVLSDSEVNPYFLPNPMDGKNAMEGKTSLKKQNAKEIDEKIMLSPASKVLVRVDNLSLSITKSKRRRKGALQEEEDSKRPALVKDYGEELVGSRIKVWWPLDQMFYEGVINYFYPSTKKHEVFYIDGDKEILNLNKERWMLLDDASMDQDQDADPPTSTVTPAKPERIKAKRMTKSKIKQDNTVSSAKRSKSTPRKRGSKSAETSGVRTFRAKEFDNAKTSKSTLRKCGSKSAESSGVSTFHVKELDDAKTDTSNAENDHNGTQK